jgi:hypothetical protein
MKFNKASLKQVAHVVADVELDPHIIGERHFKHLSFSPGW